MEHEFWHARWQSNEIGFHEQSRHAMLAAHWHTLGLKPGARVLVPLCGKSVDMLWLAEQQLQVVGSELSQVAVDAFFSENALPVERVETGGVTLCSSPPLTLICGDFFTVPPALIGTIDAVYDRAALIALPPAMRVAYATHLRSLCAKGVEILLITLDYPDGLVSSPPFAVTRAEVNALFADWCRIEFLETGPTEVKGCEAEQSAYRLTVT